MFRILLTVALLATAPTSFASQCPTTNGISNPSVFQWTHHPVSGTNDEEYYSGTLEYGEVTLMIGGESFTTRAYRQEGYAYSIPGPTMNMVPGNKYVVRYKNLNAFQPPEAAHNVLKDPNISNLHTHGLHISGETPGDDVTRFFEGGFGGDFVYDIPADHMGGTFWYHAHHHGSTFLQVSTGGFGLIVVDDSGDEIPPNVAAMTEQELIIGFLDPTNAGTSGDTLVDGTLGATWTVNGAVNGNLCVPNNEWQHWRVLLADADAKPKTVSVGPACEVELMARDGVWRTEVPKAITTNSLSLTGASRADLAVRCTGDSTISVGNTVVANVYADGAGATGPNPYNVDGVSTWPSKRPAYLRDLRDVVVVNTETVRMGARTINGSKFDADIPNFSVAAKGLQKWSLNGAKNHPFHLHIYHVQMDGTCGQFEDGEYYDVVADNCTLLFDLDTETSTVYDGRTIMHCHILEHEDQGAMGWLDVTPSGTKPDPIGPPTFPNDTGFTYAFYYSLGDPPATPPNDPSSLAAATASSSQINLSWTDNSSDEDNFEIERSPGGAGSYSPVASVGQGVTTYSDTGLSADTSYDYQVRATNVAGNSGYSNIASATTDPVLAGSTLSIGSFIVTAEGIGQGFKRGRADITVEDDQGNATPDVVVDGYFAGTFSETIVGLATDANGLVTYATNGSAKGRVSVTFCITNMTHATLTYELGTVCQSN